MAKKIAVVVGVLVLLMAGLWGYRAYLVHELRKPVLAELSDPDSAQFRGEKVIGPWTVDGSTLCGELNAKNRMGGYVGYAKFYSAYGGEIRDVGDKIGTHDIFCEQFKDDLPWWWLRW